MKDKLVNQPGADVHSSTGLSVTAGKELQIGSSVSAEMAEIQGAIILAKQFPRSYEKCWGELMEACKRETLAKEARYSYPRGGTNVTGPSVHLARVEAQCYGNIRFGLDIVRMDEDTITIRGWAWDIEKNIKVTADDHFKKLIYRKKDGGVWIKPDERDLRELVNRRGAILKRNCILEILPRDFTEDAVAQCKATLKSGIKDPKGEAKRMILKFQDFNVSVEMLNGYIGNESWDADDIIRLTEVYTALKDGAAKREDYFGSSLAPEKSKGNGNGLSTDDMKAGDPKTHQGHELKDEADIQTGPQVEPPADAETVEPDEDESPAQAGIRQLRELMLRKNVTKQLQKDISGYIDRDGDDLAVIDGFLSQVAACKPKKGAAF